MKSPFHRTPSFDASAITQTIQRALASAGLDIRSGPLHDMTGVIRRALTPAGHLDPAAGHPTEAAPEASQHAPGRFETREFTCDAGTRAYKVYIPAGVAVDPRAMMVMLHGCTQSADDFAAGTRMNRLADEQGFLVVYPEQAAQANSSKCWNWFNPHDQRRDAGEPSVIAGIVREVAALQGADTRRIFVAGLSAGAAMAVVLGATYPDLFAGVGAHSGLPYAAAHDVPSALAAMKGSRRGPIVVKGVPTAAGPVSPVPVIVFHGDRDHTVQASNGALIVQQALQAYQARANGTGLSVSKLEGVSEGGRRFSRTVHANAAGQGQVEHWTVHGGGHAWSGGQASGSFTDRSGPDASAEMLRFFMALPRDGSA